MWLEGRRPVGPPAGRRPLHSSIPRPCPPTAAQPASPPRPPGRASITTTRPAAALSDREVEVLRLVAGGLSNRQIAAALVISPRTVEHHVQHVYTKIGVSTRAAAAMFAMEHGLLR
jgi:DNA-binding NarL/FixJ family response regulator